MARVIIIDDDMMLSHVLEEHLTADGHEVKSFTMAEEGFQGAVQSPPDLLFVDVMLPDATGFQLVGRLRQHEKTKSVPIIMMTGTASDANQRTIAKTIMGANEYLLKPFDINEVSGIVRRLLPAEPVHTPLPTPIQENTEPNSAPDPVPAPTALSIAFTPEVQESADIQKFPSIDEEPVPVEEPAAQKFTGFPKARWAGALIVAHLILTLCRGWMAKQSFEVVMRSGRAVLAGWALLLGLLVAVCGALRIALTAEQAIGLLVWPAVPIVARALGALAGYKLDPLSLAPRLFWIRPLDIYEMTAILILGVKLRRLPGSTFARAILASALIALSWCLTNRGYFQP